MKVKKRQYRSKRGRPLKRSKAKSKAKKGSKRRVKKMRGGEYFVKDLDGDKFHIIKPGKDPEEYMLVINKTAIFAEKTSSEDFKFGRFLISDPSDNITYFYGKIENKEGTTDEGKPCEFYNGIFITYEEKDATKTWGNLYDNNEVIKRETQSLIHDDNLNLDLVNYGNKGPNDFVKELKRLWIQVLKEEKRITPITTHISSLEDFYWRTKGLTPAKQINSFNKLIERQNRYGGKKIDATNMTELFNYIEVEKGKIRSQNKPIFKELMAKCLEIYDHMQHLKICPK